MPLKLIPSFIHSSAYLKINAAMNRRTLIEIFVFLALVSLGVELRLFFHFVYYVPNFAPVAGLALFAGYYFRRWPVALLVPITIMVICDKFIGSYEWGVMLTVYALLALPVAARGLLRKSFDLHSRSRWQAATALGGLLACSLGGSIVFFIGTNFAHWVAYSSGSGAMYPATLAGLAQSYVQALPFFRATLGGDMFFAFLFFTAYAIAAQVSVARDAVRPEESTRRPALAA